MKLTIEMIGGKANSRIAPGGWLALPLDLSRQAQLLHQADHPFARAVNAPPFKHSMNAWASIDLPVIQKNLLNFGCKPGIFSAMLGNLSVLPRIIAALGDLKGLAEQCDRVFVSVLCNELEFQIWLREKMPIAFFKISRSCRRRSFSRFNWRISSS